MKELSGKSKDDFIKKAMKSQGYTEQEADAMVSQNCQFVSIPGTNVIESSKGRKYGRRK
ncbi:MAG: hypothetical protein IKS93_04495 [Methanobrevibacter sp.]|nr:hypothetical protein [Methanobrevibacter sp.]